VTIVRAELVFAEDRWRRRHAFAMADGRILATGTSEELARRFPDHRVEDWGNVAVLPGCVNGHDHSFQVLLRGLGDDLAFHRWRDRVLYPFSERLDRRAIRAGALLDLAELARAGVTTVVDFFYLHDRGNGNDLAVVEAAREIGIRLVLARSMYDWAGAPARYLETPEEAVRNFRQLHRELGDDPLATCQPAPHSIHGASPGMIRAGAELAAELGLPFHIHVAEGRYEREMALERYGRSPVGFLDSLGVLSERTVAVHCVWVDRDDLTVLAERGVRVVHNPSANAFLGDGVAPLRDMLTRGIPVCLGTDGGCTNSRRSVFEEMRMAALLAKARDADAEAVTAEDVLLAGTARGGEVLGLPVGRIAAGYLADLVVLDLDALSLQPPGTAEKQVVYAMQPEAVRRVLVAGEPVVEDGRPVRVDEAAVRAEVARVTAGWAPPSREPPRR
jgi:5-methylthioadenosine/S-adenosylhomocysteine deaminase